MTNVAKDDEIHVPAELRAMMDDINDILRNNFIIVICKSIILIKGNALIDIEIVGNILPFINSDSHSP